MRILYSAIDQAVPAAHGGSVHVTSVAEGLARSVTRFTCSRRQATANLPTGQGMVAMSPPLGDRRLRLLRARALCVARARSSGPTSSSSATTISAAKGFSPRRKSARSAVLEVNAPVVDHPGSLKVIDRPHADRPADAPLARLAVPAADLIVTPSAKIIPQHVPASKVLGRSGAPTPIDFTPERLDASRSHEAKATPLWCFPARFAPGTARYISSKPSAGFVRGAGRTSKPCSSATAPSSLASARRPRTGRRDTLGALPHDEVPAILAAADIGVAPFDVAAHPSLAYEFHWSPLKIFEYMASGLPVVAPRIERLAESSRDGREGLLYDAAKPDALAVALERLADRRRSVRGLAPRRARGPSSEFSWRATAAARARHRGRPHARCAS